MEQWLRSKFPVVPNGWGQGEDSFGFTNADGHKSEVSIGWFVERWGPNAPTSAAELKANVDTTPAWAAHFDTWASKGILPAE